MGSVGLEPLNVNESTIAYGPDGIGGALEALALQKIIEEHVLLTGSSLGQEVLADWTNAVTKFVKVMPHDYKRVLVERLNQPTLTSHQTNTSTTVNANN